MSVEEGPPGRLPFRSSLRGWAAAPNQVSSADASVGPLDAATRQRDERIPAGQRLLVCTNPRIPMQLPDPPQQVPLPFRDWLLQVPVDEPEITQELRVMAWIDARVCRLASRDGRDEAVQDAIVSCLEGFTHRTREWQAPLAVFVREIVRNQRTRVVRRDWHERQVTDRAADEDRLTLIAQDPRPARDERHAKLKEDLAAARSELEGQLDVVATRLASFHKQWGQQEQAVVRGMKPSQARCAMALHLLGWSWARIASHFEAKLELVNSNWGHRGRKQFQEAWLEVYGPDSWCQYEKDLLAKHQEQERMRTLQDQITKLIALLDDEPGTAAHEQEDAQ